MNWKLPTLAIGLTLVITFIYTPQKTQPEFVAFSKLPVLSNGRIKPMDSVARNALILIRGKQAYRQDKKKTDAVSWLVEVFSDSEKADQRPIFLVNNPEVGVFMGQNDEKKKTYSFNELMLHIEAIAEQASMANEIPAQLRTPFHKEVSALFDKITLYHRLKYSFFPGGVSNNVRYLQDAKASLSQSLRLLDLHSQKKPIKTKEKQLFLNLIQLMKESQFTSQTTNLLPISPQTPSSDWKTNGEAILAGMTGADLHPLVVNYAKAFDAAKAGNTSTFLEITQTMLNSNAVKPFRSFSGLEVLFNKVSPFYKSIILYVLAIILLFISWLRWSEPLSRFAYVLTTSTLVIHSVGLLSRMLLQARPPVTNLYSSAIFVGWAAVWVGLILERWFKNRMGILVAGIAGFLSLIIAHHLSLQGDTLEMMQAVLDSNFWLSTHVVTITLGYSATFLAGLLGMIYIFRGSLTDTLTLQVQNDIKRMVYGTVAFALILSFIGTVLGGIWADQSWGRFWGWDPKENGALLIVIWNALILHSRLAGYIQNRGLMVMAVFGNIITAFSWFGVNMLGIGLHSYGFMDKAFFWLSLFVATQLGVMILGMLPKSLWKSKVQ